MLHMNVLLRVKDRKDVETVKLLLLEHGRLTRAEPGCARFEIYHSTADETFFMLNEQWESQEAADAHRQAEGYTQIYKPKVLPLAEREGHPSTLL